MGTDRLELLDHLRMLRRRWRLVAASVLVATLAGLVANLTVKPPENNPAVVLQQETFTATHRLAVDATAREVLGDTAALAVVASSPEVARRVDARLGVQAAPGTTSSAASVTAEENGILAITASAETAERAVELADTFAEEVVRYTSERLDAQMEARAAAIRGTLAEQERRVHEAGVRLARAQPGSIEAYLAELDRNALVNLRAQLGDRLASMNASRGLPVLYTVEPAVAVREAASTTDAVFGPPQAGIGRVFYASALGLVLGIALAFLVDRVDTRLYSRRAAESALGLPVVAEIGMIPPKRGIRSSPTPPPSDDPRIADDYSRLRLAVTHMPRWILDAAAPGAVEPRRGEQLGEPEAVTSPRRGAVVLVTSTRRGEGRTTATTNLAMSFAESGQTVAVLDCDSQRPGLAAHVQSITGVEGAPDPMTWSLVHSGIPGILLCPAPAELTSRERARTLPAAIRVARKAADVVVVDTGPLLTSNDPATLVPDADTVVVVVRTGAVTAEDAAEARDLLAKLGAPVTGLVLMAVPEKRYRVGRTTLPASLWPASLWQWPARKPRRTKPVLAPTGAGAGVERVEEPTDAAAVVAAEQAPAPEQPPAPAPTGEQPPVSKQTTAREQTTAQSEPQPAAAPAPATAEPEQSVPPAESPPVPHPVAPDTPPPPSNVPVRVETPEHVTSKGPARPPGAGALGEPANGVPVRISPPGPNGTEATYAKHTSASHPPTLRQTKTAEGAGLCVIEVPEATDGDSTAAPATHSFGERSR